METDITQKAHRAWWEKCCHDDADVSYEDAFLAGYARGRADAWQLPEVRAEELVEGKYYWGLNVHSGWQIVWIDPYETMPGILSFRYGKSASFTSFHGPLPLGGGE